ncbi:hypothetical protein FHR97_002837 [Halomonas stenophila]|uniref:Uncharacterized protein n=1 Tax=Halomonas stenophila TaxID=795312 RepID=A0A7W5EV45_9GAMM|nr:hypothetical protein [Halomonas stenophila]
MPSSFTKLGTVAYRFADIDGIPGQPQHPESDNGKQL